MLADDIATDPALPGLYAGIDRIQRKIGAAKSSAWPLTLPLAADGLVDNFRELEKIAPRSVSASSPRLFGVWQPNAFGFNTPCSRGSFVK
jgi:hypothetical protein